MLKIKQIVNYYNNNNNKSNNNNNYYYYYKSVRHLQKQKRLRVRKMIK